MTWPALTAAEKYAELEAANVARPQCGCHGEPMIWVRGTNGLYRAGGHWGCRIAKVNQTRTWRIRNPERQREMARAHRALAVAVELGRLIREPCEICGSPVAEGHHADYSKPLEVRWLCRMHHAQHHAGVAA